MHQLHFILFTWGHALKTSPGINRKSRVSYPGHDRKSRASYPGHEFLSSAIWHSLPKKQYYGLINQSICLQYLYTGRPQIKTSHLISD